MNLQPQNLLIDFDCLLDTRVGCIHVRFPRAFRSLDVREFCQRDHNLVNEFIDCDFATWKKQWDNRDVAVVESSRPTQFLVELRHILVSKYAQGKSSPITDELKVTINTWPYNFDKDTAYWITESIKEYTWEDLPVNIVSLEPAMLTPTHIKDNYQSLFIYDWIEWMTLHRYSLNDVKIPSVTLNVPMYRIDISDEATEKLSNSDTDPVKDITRYLSEYVSLIGLDPRLFSLPYLS